MNQQIRYEVGGALTHDPPQHGRPTAASVAIYTPGAAVHITPAPTPTVDSVNTTLAAAASEGDTILSLVSVSSVEVGRYYDLEASDGRAERARVTAISGTTVTLLEPLGADYGSGSSFTGNRLTCSIPSGDADPLDEGYEARWTYTIDSESYYANTLFDIVRSPWPEVILRPHEFRQYTPGLSGPHMEGSLSGLDFVDEIDVATERVRIDIVGRGMRPDLFRTFEAFKRPVAMMVICMWAESGTNLPASYVDLPDQWLDSRREIYEQALTQALNSVRSYDADDDGTVTDSEREHRIGVRRWRL